MAARKKSSHMQEQDQDLEQDEFLDMESSTFMTEDEGEDTGSQEDRAGACGAASAGASASPDVGAVAGNITLEQVFAQLMMMNRKLDRLDPLENDVKALKKDLKNCKDCMQRSRTELSGVSESVVGLTVDVAENRCDVERLRSELVQLRSENKTLEDKILRQEAYSRRENILIHGIEEKANESCKAIVGNLTSDLKLGPFPLQRCHRIGKQRTESKGPRPIIARFLQYTDKVELMKKKNELRKKNIRLSDDNPKEINDRRLKLKPVLETAKQHDNSAKLIQDKLLYKSKQYTVDNIHTIPIDLKLIGTKTTDSHIFFKGTYSPLSNLYQCELEVDGHCFNSSEQLYQYKKACDMEQMDIATKVLSTQDPYEAMAFGKHIRTDSDWVHTTGLQIMEEILTVKKLQVPEFRDLLHEYASKEFVEATTNKTWGSGIDLYAGDAFDPSKWSGKNLLGKSLKKLLAV